MRASAAVAHGLPAQAFPSAELRFGTSWVTLPRRLPHKYLYLTLAQVHAALTYYHANRLQMDGELADEKAEADRLELEHLAAEKKA